MIENNKNEIESVEESELKDKKLNKGKKAMIWIIVICLIIIIISTIVILSLNGSSGGGNSCNGNSGGTCPIH